MDQMCPNCNTYFTSLPNFCGGCGAKLTPFVPPTWRSETKDAARYKITIEVESVFRNKDHLLEELRLSEDRNNYIQIGEAEFDNAKVKYEVLGEAYSEEEYPYECAACAITVSPEPNGRCDECGSEEWNER